MSQLNPSMPAKAASVAVPHEQRPHARIRPARGWASLNLKEAWHFRDLLMTFATRDLKVRYKQTALGVVWVVFQPLAAALIFTVVFGKFLDRTAPGDPPPPFMVWMFCGTALWTLFNQATTRSGQSMVANAHLVAKVYFPRILLPASNVTATVADFLVTMGVLMIMLVTLWHVPGWSILMAPVCVILLLSLAMGLGLLATSLAVSYRDVQHVLPVVLQLLFFASPVVYDTTDTGGVAGLYLLNPLAPILQAWRWSILGTGTVYWGYLAYSAAIAVGMLLFGALVFRRMERNFADVV